VAAGDVSPVNWLPSILRHSLPPSIGVTKHQFLIKLRSKWLDKWSSSPRKVRLDKLDEDLPFGKHRKLTDQLTRI
jgi:hypothetical protein